mgnify:CR=1 FL=1
MEAPRAVLRPINMPVYDTATFTPQPRFDPPRAVASLYDLACFLHWSLFPARWLGRFLVWLHCRLWPGIFFIVTERSLYHPWCTSGRPWPFAELGIDAPCSQCGKRPWWGHLH